MTKEQMNIFIPYREEVAKENHLTRAFMVLLDYSPSVFYMFFDYIKEEFIKKGSSHNIDNIYSSPLEYEISTQVGCEKAKHFLKSNILSVLITDKNMEYEPKSKYSERSAIYDGIISVNDEWTFIIENKPDSYNVWEEQLSPGKILSNEIREQEYNLINFSIDLTWREIFKRLGNLKCSDIEEKLINDFKNFVFRRYPTLFPYETFEQCNNNKDLLDLKIENLLKSFMKDANKVEYHRNWANKINLNRDCINQIDYKPLIENELIIIYFCFGLQVSKSKAFFNNIDVKKYKNLTEYDKSFNVRITDAYGKTVYSIPCKKDSEIDFIKYWKSNINFIKKRKTINEFYQDLEKLRKIDFLENFNTEDIKIKMGNRTQACIIPVLDMKYNLSFKEIYEYEKRGLITQKFIDITELGLSLANEEKYFKSLIKDNKEL